MQTERRRSAGGVDPILREETVVTGSILARWVGHDVGYIDCNVNAVRNRVQWGPSVAGTITALLVMLLLSVSGLAIPASAFEPGTDASD
jgi:hypothetical protein